MAILPGTLPRLLEPAQRAGSTLHRLLTADSAGPKLPVLHRLAILYLTLPVLIWLLGWFHWWLGLPAAFLLVLALWPALAGPWRPSLTLALFLVLLAWIIASITGGLLGLNIEAWLGLPATALLAIAPWRALTGPRRRELPPAIMALLLVAAGWVLLTAAGGVLDIYNADWPKHRALFFSLSNGSWPTHTPSYFSTPPLLRYSIGYYLAPGLVGQWLGLAALNWAVPLWTWCGVALMMLLFTRHYRGWRIALAVVVLICFGGMDLIPAILSKSWDWSALIMTFLGRSGIDEGWWLNIGYNAKMTNLMWIPQHFLPAALNTLLLFQLRRQPRFLTVSGVLLAANLFWSPFMALGLLPLAGVLLLRNGLRPFLRWPNLLLAPPLAGLLGVYLASGTANLYQGWLWEFHGWELVAKQLPAFYLIEFMILAGLLWLLRPQLHREPFFLISVVTLLLVPWYQMGIHGDFSRRVSLPALVLLCWYAAETLANHRLTFTRAQALRGLALVVLIVVLGVDTVDPLVHVLRATLVTLCWCAAAFLANHRFTLTRGQALQDALRGLAFVGLIVVLGIGTFNLLFQVLRATKHHNFGGFHYEQHNVNYWLALPPKLHSQYMTYDLPNWYHLLLRDKDDTHANIGLDKGELIIRSSYDVYLDDDRVIYIKDPCSQADVEPRFFLHVYPVDSNDLPAQSRQRGYDTLDFSFAGQGFRSGGKCLAIRELPRYALSRLETGQFTSGEGGARFIWEGSFAVGE